VLGGIETAIRGAGSRQVIVAAHHPFKSAGPHGGEFSFWSTLGIQYILAKSGAILQDLNSIPYRELERGLRGIFERARPPLVFVGGHEHSLQVIGSTQESDPAYSMVSGSASKLSSIGTEAGMLFGRSAPGYMRLVVGKDGAMTLFVEATAPEFQSCPEADPQRQECMTRGLAAFQTVYGKRLR